MAWESWARSPRRNFILVLALAVAALTLVAGTALAGKPRSDGSGGAVRVPKPPALTDVSCLDRCAGIRKAADGAKVELSGRHLENTDKVRFPGHSGATVKPTDVDSRVVEAKVPDGAKDGKPRVVDDFGQVAKSPKRLDVVPADQLPAPGSFRLASSSVSPDKAYYFGEGGKPTLHYIFNGDGPTDVRVDLVRRKGGETVDSWVEEKVDPNSDQTIRWNGKAKGKTAKSGEYRFRIGGLGDQLKDASGTTFGFYDHKFPIRGKHYYGDGVGAPRAGHTHQGQDVFADCGTPLVAARGGKVQFNGSQSAAGNYLVIDGKGTQRDYMYAHMKKRSKFKRGDKVKTGAQIGLVGQTGDATGCHLHFELWSAPGWYEGGHFLRSVTKQLKKWDKWS